MSTLKDWILKRGVLYALSQAPIFAVMVGFFFRLLPLAYANCAVMIAFVLLPAWIVYRKNISTDPDEPVHHLNRYALYAIMPCIAFSVARIPFMLLYNVPYWHPWYDFGHALTGEPINEFASLLPGALLYSLQGYSLGLGFYILFRKYSFINATLYLCVFLSSLYCFVFPEYGRIGMPTPPLWHFAAWWAHFWMAVAAWYMPIFFGQKWSGFKPAAQIFSAILLVLITASPYAFAFWEAKNWQFPRQHSIDRELFSRGEILTLKDSPRLVALNKEAEYEFSLRLGPRAYKNYINKVRDIDAKNIQIDAEMSYGQEFVAWCHAYMDHIESPNQQDQIAADYFAQLKKMDFTDIHARCVGPREMGSKLGKEAIFDLKWHASMMLVGDRESEYKEFSGNKAGRVFADLQ